VAREEHAQEAAAALIHELVARRELQLFLMTLGWFST